MLVRERRNKHYYGLGTWERENTRTQPDLKARPADLKCEVKENRNEAGQIT